MKIVHDAVAQPCSPGNAGLEHVRSNNSLYPIGDERRQRIWALFNAGRMSEDRATIRLLRLDLEVTRAKRAVVKR